MNKKKVSKIIAYVLLVAVVVMTAGLLLMFTRGGTTSFKTFYAEHNGKKLFGDEQLSLAPGEEHRFDVKYTFDAFVEEEEKEYSVSIITFGTEENQFTYTANGQPYGFDETTEVDVSEYFNLKKEEDHFTMELPADFSMASVLAYIHGGKAIEVAKSVDISAGWYFALKIQSYNEESTIILPFRQAPEEFEIDFNLKGVKADRKNPKVALGGYNETKLVFNFEDGFGPEGVYVLVEKCGSFNYAVEDGKLIVTITDPGPGPGVEVTVTAIQQTYKLIADELVGVEAVKDNPNTIALGKSVLLTFKLKEGYELEAYDALGGTIRLEKKDGDILTFRLSYEPEEYGDIHYCIYAAPGNGASFPVEVVYTTGALTPSTLNPQKVPVNGSVQLTFAVNPGYAVGRVVATGAEINYTYTDLTLSISVSNPTADVMIGVETRPAYDITTNTTGVIADVDNATKLVDGSNAILYFTAQSGYALPESVTVTGAGFQWTQSTGKLELRDPTGPITVEIVGVEIEQESYEISISYDKLHVTPYANNPSSIKVGEKVILRFTIHSNVGIGSVNGTGATVTYFASGQILTVTLNDTTGLVSVGINSRYQYKIATNLTNVSAVSGNPTSIADGTSVALHFTADPGYSLPASVTVTNAEYIWTQSTGKLELREPTGPITVVVEGVEIVPNNYAITTSYTAGHFTADETNAPSIEEGATVYLKFTISPNADFGAVTATGATVSHSVSGQVLTVTLKNPTGAVTVTITSRTMYDITTNLSHVSAVSGNAATIVDGMSATLYFTADSGYELPASVTVTNAEYTWTQSAGKLVLRDPTGPVTVSVEGVVIVPEVYTITTSYNASHFSPYSTNVTTIEEGKTVALRFTISANADFGTVTATGATVSHSVSGQALTVSVTNPTGPVTVTITSRTKYSITTNLGHVSAVSGNATTIVDGMSATLYFTADSGYSLPASVTVIGAGYQWNQSSGKLVLLDPSGPVTVTVEGVSTDRPTYSITTKLTNVTANAGNDTTLTDSSKAILYFTAAKGYLLPESVTVTGADHQWDRSTGKLELREPTGNVTVTVVGVADPDYRQSYTITLNLLGASSNSGNPTIIYDDSSATLYFTARLGYSLPSSVTVTGAEYEWMQSLGKLVLRNPTGPVLVRVIGVTSGGSDPTPVVPMVMSALPAQAEGKYSA